MKISRVVVALVVLAAAAIWATAAALASGKDDLAGQIGRDLAQLHEDLAQYRANPRATVHVVALYVGGKSIGNGAGVMIAPGRMLTAEHVIARGPGSQGAMVIRVGVDKVPAKVLKMDKEHDIALLDVGAMGCPCAPVALAAPPVDAEAVAVGFPDYKYLGVQVLTEGRVQGVTGDRLILTAPLAPGNSGGGVFVAGELVGIAVEIAVIDYGEMGDSPVNHLARAVDTATMREFLAGSG